MNVDVLEYQVLSTIRDRIQFKKTSHLLKEELFETIQTRTIYKLIATHHASKNSAMISMKSLTAMVSSSVKMDALPKYKVLLKKIRLHRLDDVEVVDTLVERFVRRQLLKQLVIETIDQMEAGEEADLERVQQRIHEAMGVSQATLGDSYDYFKDPYRRIEEEVHEKRIATGLGKEFDGAIGGGLAAGEIGIFIGFTGVGKSLLLTNVGYGALKAGKKVVHITLEIRARKVARRYDICISGKPFNEIREDPGIVAKKLKVIQATGGGLRIKDYTSSLCSISDIRAYLERLREQKFDFDLLIVDHADLMYSTRQYKEKRHELSHIIAGLRMLGGELNIPIWTGSQANREALQRGRTQLHNIAEDIGKANWADVAVTISQTEADKEDGVMDLKIAKNRIEKGNPLIHMLVDYDKLRVTSREKVIIKKLRRKLRDA